MFMYTKGSNYYELRIWNEIVFHNIENDEKENREVERGKREREREGEKKEVRKKRFRHYERKISARETDKQ